jgi:hypothetical protein
MRLYPSVSLLDLRKFAFYMRSLHQWILSDGKYLLLMCFSLRQLHLVFERSLHFVYIRHYVFHPWTVLSAGVLKLWSHLARPRQLPFLPRGEKPGQWILLRLDLHHLQRIGPYRLHRLRDQPVSLFGPMPGLLCSLHDLHWPR